MKETLSAIYHNKWVRMSFWMILYIAWVIWLGNYWWLLGLIVIFDWHITHKVKWMFWKKQYKEGEKHNVWLDWLDAIIFAVIVVTFINMFFFQAFKIPSSSMESSLYTGDHLFVSKVTYGPKVPETPLTVPFTHNVIFGKESYSTLIHNDYRRLKGRRQVERGDYVVFNFPHGDTVLSRFPSEDYYTWVRNAGRSYAITNGGPLKVRPVDKEDHYVKRCVAVPGDTLEVKDGLVWIDGVQQEVYPGIQLTYKVTTTGQRINSRNLEKLGLNLGELYFDSDLPGYPAMPLTAQMLEEVKGYSSVTSVEPNLDVFPPDYPDTYLSLFPFTENTRWTRDNYGPIYIPRKGDKILITEENYWLYKRIADAYEFKSMKIGKEYTFEMDYFWMMGDNRHKSADSRYWGFVPEDHIVGRPLFIWLSIDKDKPWFKGRIRWDRIGKRVTNCD